MAIIARFSFDVPFGRKEDLFRLTTKWKVLEKELGFPAPQRLIGAVGAPESRLESNYRFENMAALEATFAAVAKDPRMSEYHKEMASLIVPGSHRWDIFRIHEE